MIDRDLQRAEAWTARILCSLLAADSAERNVRNEVNHCSVAEIGPRVRTHESHLGTLSYTHCAHTETRYTYALTSSTLLHRQNTAIG